MTELHPEPMLLPTPFHSRQRRHNLLHAWGGWNGYLKPSAFDDVEIEYFAIRSTTGVFDLSPMNKYRITGPDSEAFLNRLLTRDVSRIAEGRVGYSVWCDDAGQVMDDGTLFHLGPDDYRLCSYTRAFEWLYWSTLGFDVTIVDETAAVAALAVQGPTSCTVLTAMGIGGMEQLKPFGLLQQAFNGEPLMVSRWKSPASKRASCRGGSILYPPKPRCGAAAPARPSSWGWAGWWTSTSRSSTVVGHCWRSSGAARVFASHCWT